jgi:pyridoxal phosphate enzyme (YggS family)
VSVAGLEAVKRRLSALGHEGVRLIAVSKTHPAERITELLRAGHRDFGENRQNEARDKFPLVDLTGIPPENGPIYHHIGPLQSGAARQIAGLFQYVHGASSESGIAALGKACAKKTEPLQYLLQLNLTQESSKLGGMTEEEFRSLAIPSMPGLLLVGLMTMGPSDGDLTKTRAVFRRLRKLRDERLPGGQLSMGMSHDFEVALEEGATMLRIGNLIFGSR